MSSPVKIGLNKNRIELKKSVQSLNNRRGCRDQNAKMFFLTGSSAKSQFSMLYSGVKFEGHMKVIKDGVNLTSWLYSSSPEGWGRCCYCCWWCCGRRPRSNIPELRRYFVAFRKGEPSVRGDTGPVFASRNWRRRWRGGRPSGSGHCTHGGIRGVLKKCIE